VAEFMSTAQPGIAFETADPSLSRPADAWERFCDSIGRPFATPAAVVSLKSQRHNWKSGVFRLDGSGDGGGNVIAKRCLRAAADVECAVHQRVLPRVGISTLRCYGHMEEADGPFSWIFMEDAGSEKLLQADRDLAAEWLARLHASTAALADEIPLPERGPTHYYEHLRAARAILTKFVHELSLTADDRELLHILDELMQRLDAAWASACAPCASAPRTLVHGDFGRKNTRLRARATGGRELVALDWEMAGWGPPCADIPHSPRSAPPRKPQSALGWRGTVPLDVYATHAGGRWDGAAFEDLARLACIGTLFQSVASIRWALEELHAGGTEKAFTRLRWYAEGLPTTLAAINWVR
jgi:aminoglycoside phosphotransferase (APT) family kinase protein